MQISLNKIKSYVKVPDHISDDELIKLIGSRLVEVEEVIDLAPKYRGIYIVKVVSCEAIPDTHLHLCQIDAGEHTKEFSDHETVQVVCGAPNVHTGMLAVWITPGSIVPETYGHENFRLSVRKLRGYESNGMLAGADELGFDNEHKAIAEIDPKTARPGDSLAEVFELNDLILDVENKSLTHRPDCFGLIGFAREVAGILGQKFIEPAIFQNLPQQIAPASTLKATVKIADPELCPRYTCAVFDLPDNHPSKYLTKEAVFLAKSGMRSIDPMVDLTNILMLETGQPLHAFDYDKVLAVGQTKSLQIVVRAAKENEELQLLDGKTITCTPDDILITSNNVPIALAGAMGGKNTEIDASTKRIVLESATFSLYNLRKTQMAHGIFSEAITRFTKGQPAAMVLYTLNAATSELGVEVLAEIDEYPKPLPSEPIRLTAADINGLLGTTYDQGKIIVTLENVGFKVKSTADTDTLEVTAPAWRTDIHLKEDVIEEVGRLLGYDNIPLALPEKPFIEPEIDTMLQLKSELRGILSDRLAMHEVLTYSFISKNLLERVGQKVDESYEIVNSISPELQCFRQQITPSLLDKVRENLKAGHKQFTLYEINQVARKSDGLDSDKTPVVKTHLGLVCLGDFYQLKAEVLQLFQDLKINIEYTALSSETAAKIPYLEPKRSAELLLDGQKIGAFGEIKLNIARNFKLETVVTALEIDLAPLLDAHRELNTDLKLSKFPSVERDLTLTVASDMVFGRILKALDDSLAKQGLYYTVTPTSIYQADETATTKNLSFHLKFSDPAKTLKAEEISAIMEKITVNLSGLGATAV